MERCTASTDPCWRTRDVVEVRVEAQKWPCIRLLFPMHVVARCAANDATRHQEALDTPFFGSESQSTQIRPSLKNHSRMDFASVESGLCHLQASPLPTSFALLPAQRAYCMKCTMYATRWRTKLTEIDLSATLLHTLRT